jgi:hypothetical protein
MGEQQAYSSWRLRVDTGTASVMDQAREIVSERQVWTYVVLEVVQLM